MEYKELTDVSNLIIAAIMRSLFRMGLSGELITTQVADEYDSEDLMDLLEDSGLKLEGADQGTILNSFVELMNKLGAVQDVSVPTNSGNTMEIVLKDCVFNTAAKLLRKNLDNYIPACSWMSILASTMKRVTGNTVSISHYSWDDSTNSCTFKIEME